MTNDKHSIGYGERRGVVLIDKRGEPDELYQLGRVFTVLAKVTKGGSEAAMTIPEKISAVWDHQGTLTVAWDREPTISEARLFQKAWESLNEDQVEHILPDGNTYKLELSLFEI